MPFSVESELQTLVTTFVADLTTLLRTSALGVFEEALGAPGATKARRATPSARPSAATGRRPKGAKRDPKAIEALTEKLGAHIKKTPGQRIEQIAKALGTPTKELTLPTKKLLAAKKISTRGQKRATTYFPK